MANKKVRDTEATVVTATAAGGSGANGAEEAAPPAKRAAGSAPPASSGGSVLDDARTTTPPKCGRVGDAEEERVGDATTVEGVAGAVNDCTGNTVDEPADDVAVPVGAMDASGSRVDVVESVGNGVDVVGDSEGVMYDCVGDVVVERVGVRVDVTVGERVAERVDEADGVADGGGMTPLQFTCAPNTVCPEHVMGGVPAPL